MISNAGLLAAIPALFPMDTHSKIFKEDDELVANVSVYRRLVGRLLYLTNTRLDITFSIHHLSQFLDSPREPDLHVAQRILRYLKTTPSQGFLFPTSFTIHIKGFLHSDWASCLIHDDQLVGFIFSLVNH